MKPAATTPHRSSRRAGRHHSILRAVTPWWAARTRRERILLASGAALLVLAVVWWVAVAPALHTIRAAHQTLPEQRVAAAQIQALALEVSSLSPQFAGEPASSSPASAVQSSLERNGLAEHINVQSSPAPEGDGHYFLQLEQANAATVMQWLSVVPQALALRVVRLELTRANHEGRDRPGHVSGHIVLGPAGEPD